MNKKSEDIQLSVDSVLVKDSKVLLLKRKIEPFEGFWVLPGGYVEHGEEIEGALRREVFEEVNVELGDDINFVGVYSDRDRDPRGHVVSCAFVYKLSNFNEIKLNEESEDFSFFDINTLPEKIGFDHEKIIKDSFERYGD